MDKKKWTWVLIVIVAGLWIYNIYYTVKTFHDDEVQTFQEEGYFNNLSLELKKDSFYLILPKRDPFLGKTNQNFETDYQQSKGDDNLNHQKSNNAPVPSTEIKKIWPQIEYFGFVKNRSQNHTLCMIGINKKRFKVAIGDTQNEVTIVHASTDSIELSFAGEIRKFKK